MQGSKQSATIQPNNQPTKKPTNIQENQKPFVSTHLLCATHAFQIAFM
jgi:hypothetical protein